MNEEEWSKIRLGLEETSGLPVAKKIAVWTTLNHPSPPPSAYKQELIKAYAHRYKVPILVETGTYLGDTVKASLKHFKKIYSIELGENLYQDAKKKFNKNKNVELFQGDSGQILPLILRKIRKPALFWLDAHYSSGVTAKGSSNTPILDEVKAIVSHSIKNHLILIDDARLFIGKDDYPTYKHLQELVIDHWPNSEFIDRHDVIRIQPDDQYVEV